MSRSAAVDGREAGPVGGDANGVESSPDLVADLDHGKLPHPPEPRDAEDVPLAAQRALVEELDATEGDLLGAVGHLPDGGELDQVVAHLVLAEQLGRPLVERGQLGHGAAARLDGVARVAAQRKFLGHATTQGGHGTPPRRG